MRVGKVKELYRYPVKSMGGERLQEAPVLEHGIPGDRSFAFMLDSKYLTVENMPELLNYQAKLINNGNNWIPAISTKDCREISWDENVLDELKSKVKFPGELKQISFNQTERGAYWEDHVLIISSASVEKLSELCGKGLLDLRRFRPNIVIELESATPFEEEQWIGKKITIGNVTFKVNQGCERCMYVNVDPDNPSLKDSAVLKTLVKERANIFGVYASVVETGTISEGAEVRL
ncbi:MOSC domain-containing protein [Neobacillus sp. PS3-34]|uniref:MOSC domain-containing protein n=1 Tax=Neobacillus sp. PS3-34 TaxID=3070678 RepID=UPI0027DFEDF3|nr:MOSC domain-containing protein [Neobacillus sp. PS3-34]WML49952.1 MOSC domain-containing protein [Neobacillus sp. PS3-34]